MMRTLWSDETAARPSEVSETSAPMVESASAVAAEQESSGQESSGQEKPAEEKQDEPATESADAPVAEQPVGDESKAGDESKHADDHAHEDGEAHAEPAVGDGHEHPEGKHESGEDHDHAGDHKHADGHEHEGDHEHGAHGFLDQGHLLGHVQDQPYFEFSFWLTGRTKNEGGQAIHVNVPQLPAGVAPKEPFFGSAASPLQPMDLKITKFMVIEVLVAIALVAVFVPLARKIATGDRPKGRWWNLIEAILVYVRDQIARPSIGHHDADKFLPYLWTAFFFVLFCNLFGLIPFFGSPTGALGVTGVLALMTFAVVVGTGVVKLGPIGFVKSQVPHMELPLILAIGVVPLIFVIEVMGLFIKHFVLSIRLFANMFAGHLVLAVLLAFIGEVWATNMVYMVAPASLGAATAVNLLELFVAFLQAYIFTFLSALFIGSAAHPH